VALVEAGGEVGALALETTDDDDGAADELAGDWTCLAQPPTSDSTVRTAAGSARREWWAMAALSRGVRSGFTLAMSGPPRPGAAPVAGAAPMAAPLV